MLDIQIENAEGREDTVIVSSAVMNCEFPVKRDKLGENLQALHTEYAGLVEAGEL